MRCGRTGRPEQEVWSETTKSGEETAAQGTSGNSRRRAALDCQKIRLGRQIFPTNELSWSRKRNPFDRTASPQGFSTERNRQLPATIRAGFLRTFVALQLGRNIGTPVLHYCDMRRANNCPSELFRKNCGLHRNPPKEPETSPTPDFMDVDAIEFVDLTIPEATHHFVDLTRRICLLAATTKFQRERLAVLGHILHRIAPELERGEIAANHDREKSHASPRRAFFTECGLLNTEDRHLNGKHYYGADHDMPNLKRKVCLSSEGTKLHDKHELWSIY